MNPNPIERFQAELLLSKTEEPFDATATALATADASGRPSVRYVLLKEVEERGFVFFTNEESRKGSDMNANPRAALAFFWPKRYVQVRVEGSIAKLPAHESDAYFRTRPRDSQIGAWASQQSRLLSSRDALDQAVEDYRVRFGSDDIPRPAYWGGYCLKPERIEFWNGRPNRLHDREVYLFDGGSWRVERLYP